MSNELKLLHKIEILEARQDAEDVDRILNTIRAELQVKKLG